MDDEFPIWALADEQKPHGPGCLGLLLAIMALAALAWLLLRWS